MSVSSSPDASSLRSSQSYKQIDENKNDVAPLLQRDIFGSDSESDEGEPKISQRNQKFAQLGDSSEDDDDQEITKSTQNITAHDILGSSSSDDSNSTSEKHSPKSPSQVSPSPTANATRQQDSDADENRDTGDESGKDEIDDNDGEQSNEESDEIRIAADFPLIRADLGKEMHLVKMPNFLSVETRPFDQAYYEGELDEDEVLDEEGRTRLKLKVENTIRWRFGKNENGETIHESNARIVRWSDGSLSLHLGDEIFDVHKMDIQSDFNHLFIREDRGLQGQGVFKTKLTFRPHSTDSFTHRKITLSLADKTNKSQKVKILAVAGADPESNRNVLVKREEEKLRACLRRETQQRRMQERQLASAAHRTKRSSTARSSAVFRDDDGDSDLESLDDGNNGISLAALKRDGKAGKTTQSSLSRRRYSSDSDSVDGSNSDISEKPIRKKAKISDDDESDLSD